MKKIIALLMASMLLVLSFAGCSGKTGDDEKTSNEPSSADAGDSAVGSGVGDGTGDFDYVTGKGTLVVGVTNFAPIDYLDDNNEWTGFDADFAKAVGEKLGVTVVFQEISWGSKETELASKSIDCLWNGLTITPEREAQMSISTPYMANKQVIIVKSDRLDEISALALADGLNVVAEAESAGEEVAQNEAFFATATYTAVDSQKKALMEVSSGTADACIVDYVCAVGMIGEGTDYENLSIVETQSFSDEEYGIAFRQNSDITAHVNTAITELVADGTLKTIADKYKLGDLLIAK